MVGLIFEGEKCLHPFTGGDAHCGEFFRFDKQPAAVIMYTFYDEGGQPNFALIATFSLLYSIPVVLLYLLVNKRYGFRFQGGIKG